MASTYFETLVEETMFHNIVNGTATGGLSLSEEAGLVEALKLPVPSPLHVVNAENIFKVNSNVPPNSKSSTMIALMVAHNLAMELKINGKTYKDLTANERPNGYLVASALAVINLLLFLLLLFLCPPPPSSLLSAPWLNRT